MAYVSNVLTHWVGRGKTIDEQYAILTNDILKKKELIYSLSPWHFGSKYGGPTDPTQLPIPMISFADIPFSECARHCDRYSHFGLSFDKGYLANCYASPVGYVQHPFIDNNYSYIWHVLQGMKSVLNGTEVPEGLRKGEKFDALHLLSRFQYMMAFLEGYSKAKYEYNEGAVEPLPDQEHFFEDSSALYYEREWRMVLSSTGRDLAWHVTRDGKTYFKFNERFLRWVIVPRTHLAKLKAERANIFSDYPPDQVSPIIAYEDMEYF